MSLGEDCLRLEEEEPEDEEGPAYLGGSRVSQYSCIVHTDRGFALEIKSAIHETGQKGNGVFWKVCRREMMRASAFALEGFNTGIFEDRDVERDAPVAAEKRCSLEDEARGEVAVEFSEEAP
jgi:hypothetical protein